MNKKFIKSDRRNFLKGAVVAGGAAAAAAAPTVSASVETVETPEPVKVADKGYKENDYIRNYYDRARF